MVKVRFALEVVCGKGQWFFHADQEEMPAAPQMDHAYTIHDVWGARFPKVIYYNIKEKAYEVLFYDRNPNELDLADYRKQCIEPNWLMHGDGSQ